MTSKHATHSRQVQSIWSWRMKYHLQRNYKKKQIHRFKAAAHDSTTFPYHNRFWTKSQKIVMLMEFSKQTFLRERLVCRVKSYRIPTSALAPFSKQRPYQLLSWCWSPLYSTLINNSLLPERFGNRFYLCWLSTVWLIVSVERSLGWCTSCWLIPHEHRKPTSCDQEEPIKTIIVALRFFVSAMWASAITLSY